MTTHTESLLDEFNIELHSGIHFTPLNKLYSYQSSSILVYNLTWEIEYPEVSNSSWTNVNYENIRPIIEEVLNEDSLKYSDNSQPRRFKRELLGFIGSGLKYCCGVALHDDVEQLVRDNSALDDYLDELKGSISTEHSDLVHISQNMKSFKSYTDTMISEMQASISNLYNVLSRTMQLWADIIQNTADLAVDNSRLITFFAQGLIRQQVIMACRLGVFPTLLIDTKVFKNDLKAMKKLLKKHNYLLAIDEKELSAYYKLNNVKCALNNERIIVEIKIPIINEHFSLHKMEALPFQSDDKICNIENKNALVASSKNAKNVKLIKGNDLINCLNTDKILCRIPEFSNSYDTMELCATLALLGADAITIRNTCLFTCAPRTDKALVTKLDHHKFALTNFNNWFNISCNNPAMTKVFNSNISHGAIIISLPCQCKITLQDNTIIMPSFPCSARDLKDISITHTLPVQWTKFNSFVLQHYYSPVKPIYTNITELLDTDWHNNISSLDFDVHKNVSLPIWRHMRKITSATISTSCITYLWLIALTYLFLKQRFANSKSASITTNTVVIEKETSAIANISVATMDIVPPIPLKTRTRHTDCIDIVGSK